MGTTLEKPKLTNLKEYPIADAFELRKEEIAELESRYMVLGIEPDGTGRDEVHKALQHMVKLRTGVKKTGKDLRADVNDFGKRVISCEKTIVDLMAPIEHHLRTTRDKYDEEQARKKREAEERRQAALKAKVDALAKYGATVTTYEVERMTDVEFDGAMAVAREEHEARLKREAEEKQRLERNTQIVRKFAQFGFSMSIDEADAMTDSQAMNELSRCQHEYEHKQKAAREEQERLDAERAKFQLAQSRVSKLQTVNCAMTIEQAGELTDEQFDETFQKAHQVHEAELKRQADERAAQEAEAKRLREEREKLDADVAKAAEEQREREAKETAAREERARIEREQQEAKERAEREEAERERQAALRPDREKVLLLSRQVLGLELPDLSADNAPDVQMLLRNCLATCAADIRKAADVLK